MESFSFLSLAYQFGRWFFLITGVRKKITEKIQLKDKKQGNGSRLKLKNVPLQIYDLDGFLDSLRNP